MSSLPSHHGCLLKSYRGSNREASWTRKYKSVKIRRNVVRFSSLRVKLGDSENSLENSQEASHVNETRSEPSTIDVVRLFNDTQQNMLYLNKQRLNAIEEVQKTKRANDILLARVSQLEAESQATAGECEVLNKRLQALGGVSSYESQVQTNSVSVWGELALRVDEMAVNGQITLSQATGLRNLITKRDAQAADVYCQLCEKDDQALASKLLNLLGPNRRRSLHVIHICTEMAPVAQAGSLATYITSLSIALRKKGHLVEVILPKYAFSDLSCLSRCKLMDSELASYFDGNWHKNKIYTGVFKGVAVTLIDTKHPGKFFDRENIYDHEDDFERFAYFCRAALEHILKLGKQPNILHIHNWQTAITAPLFWDLYAKQGLQNTRIMFTCQDFEYQCLQQPNKLSLCGLHPQDLHRPDRLQDNVETNQINVLKGGIIYSNKVVTVSPLYAHDVLTRDHGHGLDATLTSHKYKFLGIQNGIDDIGWNPSTDRLIHSKYSIDDLSGKEVCKAELLKHLGFSDTSISTPLVGCIVPDLAEKDLELLSEAKNCALGKGAQFVFVGASKIPRIQLAIEEFQRESAGKHVTVHFDEALAHHIVAASDILVCPCVSAPSDLWPLIGLSYGTIPVSRQTSGAMESDTNRTSNERNVAQEYAYFSRHASEMVTSLGKAVDRLVADPEGWQKLMLDGMASDYSWSGKCVDSYEDAYWSICRS